MENNGDENIELQVKKLEEEDFENLKQFLRVLKEMDEEDKIKQLA